MLGFLRLLLGQFHLISPIRSSFVPVIQFLPWLSVLKTGHLRTTRKDLDEAIIIEYNVRTNLTIIQPRWVSQNKAKPIQKDIPDSPD